MALTKEQLSYSYKSAVTAALKTLLSEKHLYQSVEVSADLLQQYVLEEQSFAKSRAQSRSMGRNVESEVQRSKVEAESIVRDIKALPWVKSTSSVLPAAVLPEGLAIGFPTILTSCHLCDGRWPFNPASSFEITLSFHQQKTPVTALEILVSAMAGTNPQTQQILVVQYQCQQCKGSPVTYMVRRVGQKITLVGRDPLEVVEVPPSIPKSQKKYYSNAVVAHHAGQTLSGIFMLRVFIEQFWHSLQPPSAATDTRTTGDEIGEAYNRTLPEDFKSRFPSLPDIYSKLSVAMHTANSDAELFTASINAIQEHFDARKLFKISIIQSE